MAVAAAAVVLLAGCAQQGPAAGTDLPPASGASPRGEACTGFQLVAPWLGQHARAHVPPGWEATRSWSSIHVEAWACERIVWGSFERGPVHLLFETHDQQAAPAGCRAVDEITPLVMLQSLWTDDPDLAAALAGEGLPANWAPMSSDDAPAGDLALRAWVWGLADGASRVEVPLPGSSIPGAPTMTRLFWDNGTAVSSMDLATQVSPAGQRTQLVDVIPQMVPWTDFAQPMLLADAAVPMATAYAFGDGAWSADIRHYGDLRCDA